MCWKQYNLKIGMSKFNEVIGRKCQNKVQKFSEPRNLSKRFKERI